MRLTRQRAPGNSDNGSSIEPIAPPKGPIPSLIKRNTFYFASALALQGSGGQLVVTMSSLMVLSLLGSPALAGIGLTILGVSRLLISYPMGRITDTYGRKPGMVLGLIVATFGALTLGGSLLLHSFPVFIAGMVIFGLGVGAAQQLRIAATDMYPPSRRAEGLGYIFTGTVVASLGAPFLIIGAKAWATSLGIDPIALAWILSPVLFLPAMALILLVKPDPKEIGMHLERYWPDYKPAAPRPGGPAKPGNMLTFLRHYPKLVAYAASAAAMGTMPMMMVMTSVVLAHHGHGLAAISLSVTVHVLGMFGLSIPLGKLGDRVGRKPLLLVGMLVMALGALTMPLTPNYWMITFGIFLVGLGWSAVNVSSTTLIADTTSPQERGRAIGTGDTFGAAFNIVMPLLGGFIVEFAGLYAVGIVGASLMVVPFLMAARLREGRPGEFEEPKIVAEQVKVKV